MIQSVSASPNPVKSGDTITISVLLDASAPAGGFPVMFRANPPIIPLPIGMGVNPGSTSVTITAIPQAVTTDTSVNIAATSKDDPSDENYFIGLIVQPSAVPPPPPTPSGIKVTQEQKDAFQSYGEALGRNAVAAVLAVQTAISKMVVVPLTDVTVELDMLMNNAANLDDLRQKIKELENKA